MMDSEYKVLGATRSDANTMDAEPSRFHLYQSAFILNLVYLICGTTYAWSSPVLVKLDLSESEGSNVASMLSLGSVLGPFISGLVLDPLGRKVTVALSMVLMTASYLLLTFADGFLLLSVGRFIAGITSGITFSAVPLYIAELSEDCERGFLNTLSQIFCCVGSLLIYSIGPFVSYAVLHYILLTICALFFLLFPLLPDSPYSQIMKHEVNSARETLTWLREDRPKSYVEKELQLIQSAVSQNQAEKGSVKDLFTAVGNRRALILCLTLIILQQLSGVTIVFFYVEQIFHMTGSTISSSACSVVIGIIMTISGVICPVAVKYYGYKKPLLASTAGMAIGMGGLGVFFLLKLKDFDVDSLNWLPLLSVVIFIVFFNTGFATIPWALSGELFPSNVKSHATCLITVSCGVAAFLTTDFFPDLILLLGLDFLFMLFSFFCCLTVIYITLAMQDTSGLSFAEIQEILNGQKRKNLQPSHPL